MSKVNCYLKGQSSLSLGYTPFLTPMQIALPFCEHCSSTLLAVPYARKTGPAAMGYRLLGIITNQLDKDRYSQWAASGKVIRVRWGVRGGHGQL